MHEFAITSSIIEILVDVAREKKIKRIKKVNFVLNPLGSIEKESIKFYFDFLTDGNQLFEDCNLSFKKERIKIICSECGKETITTLRKIGKCKFCGSFNIKISESEDIRIESIEV